MRQNSVEGQHDQRFSIIRPLGRGGFGAVYEAVDQSNDRRVALKELTRVSPSALFRFKQEFRALADLHHPNLVRLHELFEQGGRWYIVMELVEGLDLLTYVARSDNDARFDEERLRSAFVGVAEGIEALHAFGILHRDLKPSNIMVTPEGRAVVLDFGLVTSTDSRAQSTHVGGVGTVLYMAPEQVDGQKLGRATDWYAFGSTLYEALTGQPPYEGTSAMRIALDKQRFAPASPHSVAPDIPADLSELAMRLLEISPQNRPRGSAVLRILRREAPCESLPCEPTGQSIAPLRVFAGRDTEMEHLENALTRTHRGELRIVLVEGESGVGKSELVAEFLRRQEQQNPKAMALRGRCYENEQVPYKAFDGCIDELARHLRRMGKDAASLMPVQAPLLAQLFPVLLDVKALTRARAGDVAADPTARRLQAFAALGSLLGSLAEERPLMLVIDDLQWADSESFRMLRALVEGQARPPILVLATVRPREELDADIRAQIEAVREWQCTDVVSLLGLPRHQAETLARQLLGPGQDPSWASTIALESRGHPLFLAELIHFTQSRELGAHGTLTLDAALRARIERLPRSTRAVLELAALAARPHEPQLLARALGLPRIDEAVRSLLAGKLLRTRRGQEVGCYHDRIRNVAVGLIPKTRLPELHRALAEALAQGAWSDATEEATHWDLAGEFECALHAYERAAQHASRALAFAKAERLLARALELAKTPQHPSYAGLTTSRAHALACAGRCAEAAALYQRAAELSTDDAQRLRLRSRTAQQLMLSGSLSAGLEACRTFLKPLGVTLPKSALGALLAALWHRLWTRFPRNVQPPVRCQDLQTDLVLDALSEQISAVTVIDLGAFLALSAQFARTALKRGHVGNVGVAYACEGWLRSTQAGMPKAAPFFAAVKALGAAEVVPARIRTRLLALEGSALLANFQWAEATTRLQAAERLYETECADDPWGLTLVRYHLGAAWYRTGEHAHLARRASAWIDEARERNDRFAVCLLSGLGAGVVRHLMRGRPEQARCELEESIAGLPEAPFAFAHFGHMIGMQYALTLQGGSAAWDWFSQRAKQHDRALLLRTRLGKETLGLLRAQCAIRALEVAGPSQRKVLLEAAQSNIQGLPRRSSPFTRAFVILISAELAAVRGETENALRLTRTARAAFEAMGDSAWRAAAYLEGVLEAGESGKAKCEAVLAFYENQGWMEPEHAVLLLVPALPLLMPREAPARSSERRMIQHYEVLSSLGSGGFGSVVEARDTRSGELVALKELVSQSPRSLERFKQEFRALRDLHHPNLARFDALFEHRGSWYITMELVRGQDLVSYVRPEGKLDLERLCTAFSGLLAGVAALHEAGIIHRDISAENVCVDAEGRAVLLDFGLMAREHSARDADAVGNVNYAPPEQLEGVVPHHSADAYALGVCLYQALTGHLPVPLPPSAYAIRQKRTFTPARPSVPEAFSSLATYCLQLLSAEPAMRPPLSALRALLRGRASEPAPRQRASLVPVAPMDAALFAGRHDELGALQQAARRAEGTFTLVLVEGQSGMGKSALVSEFARRFQDQSSMGWTLSGRCYESEQLSLKAFDGVVDQLARHLRALPRLAAEELLPKRAALLAQLFPVLGSVPAIEGAPKKGLPADPGERRGLALGALVELFMRVARERPLLVLIDDLQWADPESELLLRSLAARAEALPMLVIATLRGADEISEEVRAQLELVKALPCTSTLTLGNLDASATEALTAALLGPEVSRDVLMRITRESQGHPLFLRELAAQVKAGDIADRAAPVSLDQALAARIARFEPHARRFLSLVALAGKPYPARVFATALELERAAASEGVDPLRVLIDDLLNQGLLRRRGDTGVACYHDRIRHVALATLGAPERARCSAQLARALDLLHPQESAERARLWDEAGNRESARIAHEEAGDAALEKLAFAQAEQHYARALGLADAAGDARTQRVTIQRAHALVRMGKSADAARLYAAAAEQAEGELRVRLRIWAAQNLIQGAQVEDGLRSASQLFGELGIPFAKSDGKAVGRILWEDLRLKWRGTALDTVAPAAQESLALEALNELAQPVASMQFLRGAALSAQYVRRALAAGDPAHAARALAYEAMLRTIRNPWADHSALFARARELAESTGDPVVIASVLVRGGIAGIAKNDYPGARTSLVAGHELISTQCPGQPWLLTTTRMYLGGAWYFLGEDASLATQGELWVMDAKRRGDAYAYAAVSGYGAAARRHLMRGAPEAALRELTEAMAPWPVEPISINHIGALCGTLEALFLQGGEAGLRYLDTHRARLESAPLVRSRTIKLPMAVWEANAGLAAMTTSRTRDARLVRHVTQQIRVLRGLASPLSIAHADLLSAALSTLHGKTERALREARVAHHTFVGLHHSAASAASYLEGWLEGGAGGRAKREGALSTKRGQGWSEPMHGITAGLPLFHLLPPP